MTRMRQVIALAGLATGLGLVFSTTRAEADQTLTMGIVVDQPVLVPTGDPQYAYQFELLLEPGSTLHSPTSYNGGAGLDNIVVSNLMYANGLASFKPSANIVSELPSPFTISPPDASTSYTITYYNPGAPDLVATTQTGPIDLGTVKFGTNIDTTAELNSVIGSTLGFTSTADGVSYSGPNGAPFISAPITLSTPEPGAIALILTGIPVALVYVYRRRTRAVA